jgi:ankyrin repeat protein
MKLFIKKYILAIIVSCSLASSLHSVPTLRTIIITKIQELQCHLNQQLIYAIKRSILTGLKNDVLPAQEALTQGADPDAQDKLGQSPIHITCENNNIELTQLLLNHKADPNGHRFKITPLMIAAKKSYSELATLLLMHGADPNKTFGFGRIRTALEWAVYNHDFETARVLLRYGADTTDAIRAMDAPNDNFDLDPYLQEQDRQPMLSLLDSVNHPTKKEYKCSDCLLL